MTVTLLFIALLLGGASALMWYLEAKPYLDYKEQRDTNKPNNNILLSLYEIQTVICGITKLIPLFIDLLATYILTTKFSSGSQLSFIVGLGVSDVIGLIIVVLQYRKKN